MAINCYCSVWPEEGVWDQIQVPTNQEMNSFSVPWLPCVDSDTTTATNTSFLHCHGYNSWSMSIEGVEKDRAASSSRSHSQAEKRRRDRINAQLATLRKLIPMSDKMDKAALLGSVVEHVKDLKIKALEISKTLTVPTDVDEVTIDCFTTSPSDQSMDESFFIKASICCDDRPELFQELTQALRGLNLNTVKADMACLGGRVKSILILCAKDGVCKSTTIQSLRGVLGRLASSSAGSSYRIRSKRQRFFLPTH